MWATLQPLSNHSRRRGFTIVELLIVIVVIGILAAIVIVAYNGIKARADEASLQSEVSQLNKKLLVYKVTNSDALPIDASTGGFTVANNHTLYYRVTPDGKNYCLASSMQGDPTVAYSATSTQPAVKKGTCEGYVVVPGSATFSTSDFWVMKYEAKNVSGRALSQAANTPWVSINQTDAISTSAAACDGCHLTSEGEWMTIAANVLGVATNWSGGSVGSGYIYSGHNDNSPANALAADTNDANGYSGTGNSSGETALTSGVQGNSQRRTLTLTNGEVIWDFSGDVWEWTAGTIAAGGQQPGLAGEVAYAWKQWNNGSLLFNGLPPASRPLAVSGAVASYSSAQGIGTLYSNYGEGGVRAFIRGGGWYNGANAGVLALNLDCMPSITSSGIGFRVSR